MHWQPKIKSVTWNSGQTFEFLSPALSVAIFYVRKKSIRPLILAVYFLIH